MLTLTSRLLGSSLGNGSFLGGLLGSGQGRGLLGGLNSLGDYLDGCRMVDRTLAAGVLGVLSVSDHSREAELESSPAEVKEGGRQNEMGDNEGPIMVA